MKAASTRCASTSGRPRRAEVAGNKSAPIQTPQAGPVAAYSFDDGEGSTAEDVTGDDHEGTIEGATWTNGKYGDALQFDGDNYCVTDAPNATDLRLSEEFTLESWVKPEGELQYDPVVFKEGEGFPSYALGVGIPHSGKAEGVIGQEGEGHENVYSSESSEPRSGAISPSLTTAQGCGSTSMANWSPTRPSKTQTQATQAH